MEQRACERMSRPINIYLDQSAYGQFLNQCRNDWRQAPVAKILLREQAAERAFVWASPTNVLETLQSEERARQLATIILALTSAKRMWGGSDFERVRDFLEFFEVLAPGFWRQRKFFDHRHLDAQRNWIAGLALLACPEKLELGTLIDAAAYNKTVSRLLHARFAADPDKFVCHLQKTIEGMEVTKDDPFADIDKMTIADMEKEIASLALKFQKLSKKALQRLDANRQYWAGAYGAMEIGRLLGTIFDLPLELMLMLDVTPVVRNWDGIKKNLGWKRSLPKEIATADDNTLVSQTGPFHTVLQEMFYAAAKAPLLSSRVGYEVILRELQRCFNQKKIPTGGLTFDADHSVAVCSFDIILSNDAMLVDSLKTLSGMVARHSKGMLRPSVVTTAGELEKALKTQTALITKLP